MENLFFFNSKMFMNNYIIHFLQCMFKKSMKLSWHQAKKDLADAAVKLKGNVHTSDEHQCLVSKQRQEALKKRSDRQIAIEDAPPSIPGNTFIPTNMLFIMCSIFSPQHIPILVYTRQIYLSETGLNRL